MGPEFTGSLAEFQSRAPPRPAHLLTNPRQTPDPWGLVEPSKARKARGLSFPSRPNWNSAPPAGTFLVPKQDSGHLRIWLQGWSFRKGYGTNMESTQLLQKRHGERVKIEGEVPEKQAKLSLTLFKATKKSLATGLTMGQQSGYLTSQQEKSRLPTSSNQKPQSYLTRRKPPRY